MNIQLKANLMQEIKILCKAESILENLEMDNTFGQICSDLQSIIQKLVNQIFAQKIQNLKEKITISELLIAVNDESYIFKENLMLIISKLSNHVRI